MLSRKPIASSNPLQRLRVDEMTSETYFKNDRMNRKPSMRFHSKTCTCGRGLSVIVVWLISDPPEITKPQTATWKMMAGKSATIECLAEGNPSPQFVWTNAASSVVTTDRYLNLREVNDGDGGIYTCTAINSLGSDKFLILVKVTSKFQLRDVLVF